MITGSGIISQIIIGLIVGALARFIKPGADPMGWIMTMAIGIGGSFLAGFVVSQLGLVVSSFMGFAASVVGAVVLLFVYEMIMGKK